MTSQSGFSFSEALLGWAGYSHTPHPRLIPIESLLLGFGEPGLPTETRAPPPAAAGPRVKFAVAQPPSCK